MSVWRSQNKLYVTVLPWRVFIILGDRAQSKCSKFSHLKKYIVRPQLTSGSENTVDWFPNEVFIGYQMNMVSLLYHESIMPLNIGKMACITLQIRLLRFRNISTVPANITARGRFSTIHQYDRHYQLNKISKSVYYKTTSRRAKVEIQKQIQK